MMMVKQLGADVGGLNGLVLQSTHLEVMYLASMEPPTLSTTQQLMVELSQSLVVANSFVVRNLSLTILGSYKVTLSYESWSITTIKVAIRPGKFT